MAIVRCEKGHYYDDRSDENCPVCRDGLSARARSILKAQAAYEATHESRRRHRSEERGPSFGTTTYSAGSGVISTPPEQQEEQTLVPPETPHAEPEAFDEIAVNKPYGEDRSASRYDIGEYGLTDAPNENTVAEVFSVAYDVAAPPVEETEAKDTPILGWLVCMDGPDAGKEFGLHRALTRFAMYPDRSVCCGTEADDHPAFNVNYVASTAAFSVRFCTERAAKQNDGAVETTRRLFGGDLLYLDENVLCFLPFCGENGHWTTEEDKTVWVTGERSNQ